MDIKGTLTHRSASLLILCILVVPAVIFTATGSADNRYDGPGMPFDTDLDGMDDRLTRDVDFPIWSFVHAGSGDADMVVKELERSGAFVRSRYSLVPIISARFDSMGQIEDFRERDTVSSIELQGSVSLLQDVSVKGIKASRSTRYSPNTAQDLGMYGEGITIAVIDTGVDNEHPTFEGAFVAGADLTVPESPLTPRDGTYDPDDRTGHGTAVASIALGRGNEEGGLRGVAPGAGLIDLKVAGALPFTLNQNSMMDSLQWCSDNIDTIWGDGYRGVDVVSMSLAIGDGSVALANAMDELVSQGIVVIQGAGNTGSPYSSGAGTTWSDLSIVVGAINDQDTVERNDDEYWTSSTTGPRTDDGDDDPFDELRPDVVAPGVGITFASSSRSSLVQPASGWSEGSGTSYAVPHMAGTAALMLQARSSIGPQGSENPLRRIVHQTSEARGEPYNEPLSGPYNVKYGFGILDAYSAVRGSISYTGVNNRPEISYFEVRPNETTSGSVCRVRALATDVDEEPLDYDLSVDDGQLSGEAPLWDWVAPDDPGNYYFNLVVTDTSGGSASAKTSVIVKEGSPNRPPVITSFQADQDEVMVDGSTTLSVVAIDQDGDPLDYDYQARRGSIQGTGAEVTYTAPEEPMKDLVTVTVMDGNGGSDTAELEIEVIGTSGNRPPSVTMVNAEPSVIDFNNSGKDKKLFALVEDPDGSEDIAEVVADLSSLYGDSKVRMRNDGLYPDKDPDDLWYSLLLDDLTDLENGVYTVKVTVYDQEGASDTGMTQIEVNLTSTGSVEVGRESGVNPVLIGVLVAAALLIVLGIAAFFVIRGRDTDRVPYSTPGEDMRQDAPRQGAPLYRGGGGPVQPR
ncbi:MAG: S8 family serine peptidase [Thermoplasmatota archaeon]